MDHSHPYHYIHHSIKARFGAFPTFWQDLLTWEYTRSVSAEG